jgi:hypothetical protein
LHRIVENAGITVKSFHHHRVSVIGAMQGDGTVAVHPEGVIERTHAPEALPSDGFAVQCRTSGSPLDWMDSWVFFCANLSGVDSAILGRFCFCKIKSGPTAMASVRRGYVEGSYNLRGTFNADSVQLEAASVVLFTRN